MTSIAETKRVISTGGRVVCGWSGETPVFVALLGTLKYRGFSAAQDGEACPASVEMTVCIGCGGEANADSSASLRNDNKDVDDKTKIKMWMINKDALLNDKQRCGMTSIAETKRVISTGGRVLCGRSGETPVFVALPGTLKYRGFSAAQDDEACPASVEMTVCRGCAGEANADSSAALRNDKQ